MGSRGSTAKKSGGGGAVRAQDQKQETSTFKTVTQKSFDDFVDSQNPQDYIGLIAPENIQVGGVEFAQINSYELLGSDANKRYITAYQSTIPDSKGEYPGIDLVVKQTKTKKKTSYSWDKSPVFGTKMY